MDIIQSTGDAFQISTLKQSTLFWIMTSWSIGWIIRRYVARVIVKTINQEFLFV